jgi:flagellar FliL protein
MLAAIVVMLSLVGGGAGGSVGVMLGPPPATEHPAVPDSSPGAEGDAGETGAPPPNRTSADEMRVVPLPAILTNLAAPEGTWIRLEGALLVGGETSEADDVLARRAAAGLVTFLRTVEAAHVEGPTGFLHLRDDLNNLVATLSRGEIREVLIQSMVLE